MSAALTPVLYHDLKFILTEAVAAFAHLSANQPDTEQGRHASDQYCLQESLAIDTLALLEKHALAIMERFGDPIDPSDVVPMVTDYAGLPPMRFGMDADVGYQHVNNPMIRIPADVPTAEATKPTAMEQYRDVLNAQRRSVESDPSNPYMVGLYNGMLMMICNMDNTLYKPLDVQKPTPSIWKIDHLEGVYREAELMNSEHPSTDVRKFATSVLQMMDADVDVPTIDQESLHYHAKLIASHHPSKDARAFAKSVLSAMGRDLPSTEPAVMTEPCQ